MAKDWKAEASAKNFQKGGKPWTAMLAWSQGERKGFALRHTGELLEDPCECLPVHGSKWVTDLRTSLSARRDCREQSLLVQLGWMMWRGYQIPRWELRAAERRTGPRSQREEAENQTYFLREIRSKFSAEPHTASSYCWLLIHEVS